MKKLSCFLLAGIMAGGTVQAENLSKLTSGDCKVQMRRAVAANYQTTEKNLFVLASIRDDSIQSLRHLQSMSMEMLKSDANTAEKGIRKHQTALSNWNKVEEAFTEINNSAKELAKRDFCDYAESYLLLGSALAKKDVALYSQNMQFQLSLAKLYLENRRPDLALASVEPLLNQKNPDQRLSTVQKVEASSLMGKSLFAIKDYAKATTFFEQSISLMEQNNIQGIEFLLDNLYQLAASQYLNNAFLKGEKTFERIKQLNKDGMRLSKEGSLYDQDIVTQYKNGDIKDAILDAEKKIESSRIKLDELQEKLNTLLRMSNEKRQLMWDYDRLKYAQGKTMLTLAEILQAQSQFDKALDLYKQILARDKNREIAHRNDFQIYSNIGQLYSTRKEFKLAEENYLTAYELAQQLFTPFHPSLTTATANLAYTYKINGKTDLAEGLYLQLSDRLSDASIHGYEELPVYHEALGDIYLAKGNFQDAKEFYELAFAKYAVLQASKKTQLIRCGRSLIVVYKKLGKTARVSELEKELSSLESPPQKLKAATNKKIKA